MYGYRTLVQLWMVTVCGGENLFSSSRRGGGRSVMVGFILPDEGRGTFASYRPTGELIEMRDRR